MYAISGLKSIASAGELNKESAEEFDKSGIILLHKVSFSLAAITFLFLVAFWLNNSVSLSWFFLSVAIAFLLIPFLARKGYENSSKLLLLAYVNISILILSSVFGKEMFIQAFYLPACGLSILLFDSKHVTLRNVGIGIAVLCYLVLDYIIFDKIMFTAGEGIVVKWAVLGAAFITTWMTFNKFSESKEHAEQRTEELLVKTQELNEELVKKKQALEQKVEELKKAKEKIEAASKAKSEFLSTMSHEIRTPMNAIIGMTNLLVEDDPREDQLEQLEILDFSAKTLLALINDVLDFSKIESGKIELEKISFDLHNLLNSVLESFRFTAEKKEVSLKLKTGDELPRKVVGDPNRLTQILNNLVSNAVKFTDEGKVVVSVEKKEQSQDQVTLLFAVEDTGIGIASQKQEDIFESFTQERSDTSRMFGGTGLGLSISKKLVALQNGDMHLESEKGKGSTFYFELSFGIDEKSDDQKMNFSEQGKAVSLEGATVLLAEDNAINQKVMLRFLDKWKINPIVVEDGEEVLNALRNNKVHLVLMDLQMPKMDGYEATRKIRQLDDKKSEVPIVALTAAALTEVRDKVFDAGMDDYLTKPFNPSEMQKKLEYYILGGV